MDFEQLDLLVAIDATGSISGAARALGLSPSVATRRLEALERAVDARLVQRNTRNLRLTESGKAVLQWSRRTLGELDALGEEIEGLKGQAAGIIKVALSDHAASMFLPPFLQEFSRRHPKIRYQLETTDHLGNPFEAGYDVALHAGLIPDSTLIGAQIRTVRRILCASPDYLARRGTPSSPADLAAHDCLAHSPSEPSRWHFKRDGEIVAQPIAPFLTADSYLALVESARSGLGILRISARPVLNDLRSGRLVQVMADWECVHAGGDLPAVWIIYPDRHVSHRTRVFISAFTDYMRRVLD